MHLMNITKSLIINRKSLLLILQFHSVQVFLKLLVLSKKIKKSVCKNRENRLDCVVVVMFFGIWYF